MSELESDLSHLNHDRIGCGFDGLADETLLQIMSHFDFFTMLRMMRMSRRFSRLVKDRNFDELMFRKKPTKPCKESTNALIHPLLSLSYGHRGILDAPLSSAAFSGRDGRQAKVVDQININDYATSPACTAIWINYGKYTPPMTISNLDGIRVIDVLHGMEKMWGKINKQNGIEIWEQIGSCDRSMTFFKHGKLSDKSNEIWVDGDDDDWVVVKCWSELLSLSNYSFKGWREPVIEENGIVYLTSALWTIYTL